jgi:hypothetical protein
MKLALVRKRKLVIAGHNLACQNLGKKQKFPLSRKSSWELRIV